MKNLKAIERDKWFESIQLPGLTVDEYLAGRIKLAFEAGWDAALANNSVIIGALDTLGVALSEHGHVWTDGERTLFEQAIAAAKQEPLNARTEN